MDSSKGSEWRKWDLHVHCPGTKLNDQFSISDGDKWAVFCKRLHDSDVHAFGITDYFSADGYLASVTQYRKQYPASAKVF
jgi:hypothetical protein